MNAGIPRRRVLGVGAGIGAGAVLGSARTAAAQPRSAAEIPVSMAMHVHSCFSEGGTTAGNNGGGGSMMAHLDQATKHGVDVIWWTDHDWRMQAYGYYQGIRFDGTAEGGGLEWQVENEGSVGSPSHAFVSTPHSPNEAGNALRATATGPAAAWGSSFLWAKGGNSFYTTNISDTTITVDVLGELIGANAELVVEVITSYRPATAGRPAGAYVLQYRLGATAGRTLETPLLGVVTTQSSGGWQTLTMRLRDDIKAFWPDLIAMDSSLARLRFGVRARNGATAQGVFDHLRFTRTRDQLTWPVQTQRSLMTWLRPQYPAVTQYLSAEVSMVRHLNVFMENFELFPYPPPSGPPSMDGSVQAATAMVRWYHDRGALVQYNHPPVNATELVSTRALGADLIEIANAASGDDALLDRIGLFDVAARNAIFLTATSGGDDHVGRNWLNLPRHQITSVWAASKGLPDLLAALASGQAWFHHLQHWPNGQLDLTVAGQRAMGKVLQTDAASTDVAVSAVGLPSGATVQIVAGACDRTGTTPSITKQTYPASAFVGGPVTFRLDRQTGRYLRVEVYDSTGRLIGFGNPIWVLPAGSGVTVPAQRRLQA